ncbi:helix-turn-helix transcriptional regulator (plasmid) [Phaeobacter inhibens]|uniref:helix-turn-helix transcriptional regulator n=1 Tax=Phaeobacter inhibens TaxID=221822 RepID=UPI0021A73F23|nr:helix-turn-helix transcriptional regulator [Phaeobacter inhibens]UWR54911.1 helix-turn-helix transcriptional regulator [Phaeobacter inhibens]UWR66863.1 helix-turn-helix transcriptional regulator [Phaeobacter inhibens]UWR70517.1 helix-turn-helix transcriptional regulator [Phaeobacter inhibens]UWR86261.1 helix-turn-helix transcriptional regulator [Phaeobacter inhibens]
MDPAALNFDQETFRLAAAVGLLVLSAFCAHLLLLPDRHRHVRFPLALFFVAQSIELMALPASYLLPGGEPGFMNLAFELIEIPMTMSQPFLLWLYVLRLTSDPTGMFAVPRSVWHSLPIGFACVLYLYILLLPAPLQASLQPGAKDLVIWQSIAMFGLYSATILFYVLVPIYSVMILQRLSRYKTRLKDLFASTENRELGWARWLAISVVAFWAFNVIAIVVSEFNLSFLGAYLFDSLLAAIIVRYTLTWSIALWGMRQRPGIVPPNKKISVGSVAERPLRKYGRSGLSDARLERIATKIEALMRDEQLYLQPDLSLWDLSDRIGVTTHYTSQALNEKIGQRFFDYINHWRIQDAKNRLRSSDATILAIAYDVGFNSRSSFYTAFKRELGLTPSQYRSKMT